MANEVNRVASGVVKNQKIKRLASIKNVANLDAWRLVKIPEAIGRCWVLDINLSMSASITMLYAFAAPAAKVPPINEAKDSISGGQPFAARKSAGTVVIIRSSTTRNFINSKYGRTAQDY